MPNSSIPTLVLFDIDGTLLHTNGVSKRLFCQGLSETFGQHIEWGDYSYGGQPDMQVALDLLARQGIGGRDARAGLPAAFERLGELWDDHPVGQDIVVYPGVKALIREMFLTADLFLGQLTANVRAAARGKLVAGEIDPEHFPVGGYGDDAIERNDLLPVAIERCQTLYQKPFKFENTVVIGDSPADIACARYSGAGVIAVATGRYSADDLAKDQPDLLIDDMDSGRNRLLAFLQT